MSYCRFSDADVYVFNAVSSPSFPDGSLECCACSLGPSFRTTSVDEFAAHLDEHTVLGHYVPDDVMPAIRADFPSGVVSNSERAER